MYEYFFTLPYAIFGAPTLLLIILVLGGLFLGFLDLDFDLDSDSGTTGFASSLLVSTGVSRVPLMLGLLVTFAVCSAAIACTYDYVLVPLIPSIATMVIYVLHPFYFVGSLYVAGFLFKVTGIERIFTSKDTELPTPIIGLEGYAVSEISAEFGRGTVNIKGGAVSFSARPVDSNSVIPLSTNIKVVSECASSKDDASEKIYLVTEI